MTEEILKEVLKKHSEWLKTRFSDEVIGQHAELRYADLRSADLYGAELRDANLYGADLRGAELRYANLYGADLRGAELRYADLYGANLYGADLRYADLRGAIGIPLACPEKGEFTGFKQAHNERDKVIVELLILSDSKRSSASGRKCRCDKAKVIDITSLDGNIHYKSALSFHDANFVYTVGETVTAKDFDYDRWNECAPGIHFFITRQEAEEY